jgi:hypothetical protein
MRERVHNHRALLALLLLAGICGQAACAGKTATTPDGLSGRYVGAWVGTTSDGTAIAFAVSDGNIVTQITVGRDNRGCREAQTFSSLSLLIGVRVRFGLAGGTELRASARTVLVHGVGAGHGRVPELRELRKRRGILDSHETITTGFDAVMQFVRTRSAVRSTVPSGTKSTARRFKVRAGSRRYASG